MSTDNRLWERFLSHPWYKVSQNAGSYITATFFNIDTLESQTLCVRDYDYSDGSRDINELYYLDINPEARKLYLHHNGYIVEGDQIIVVKGRKVKVGTVATVIRKYPIYDKYKRFVATYVKLSTGESTNIENCKLL